MKTTQEIAQTILTQRNSMNPVILPGLMHAQLGAEGMQEALQRRWLVPNMETGNLQVSIDLNVVEEIRNVAAQAPAKQEEAHVSEAHSISLAHAHRERDPINELMAPGTGHDNSAPFKAQTPATPTTPVAPTAGAQAAPGVGDTATVAEAGKTFTGVIGSVGHDGTYQLTFGNERPPVNRSYKPTELKVTQKAGAV